LLDIKTIVHSKGNIPGEISNFVPLK